MTETYVLQQLEVIRLRLIDCADAIIKIKKHQEQTPGTRPIEPETEAHKIRSFIASLPSYYPDNAAHLHTAVETMNHYRVFVPRPAHQTAQTPPTMQETSPSQPNQGTRKKKTKRG